MKQEHYDLSNAYFQLGFTGGFLTEILPGVLSGAANGSRYLRSDCAIGGLSFLLQQGSEATAYQLDTADSSKTQHSWHIEHITPTMLVCSAAPNPSLHITQTWRLVGDCLQLNWSLTNHSDTPIHIPDLAIHFSADSDFSWGCNTSAKVIGHHALSGHNSHFFFERCDGHGPILMILPDDQTHLEYFEQPTKRKGDLRAYIHSALARADAIHAGAKIHLPATELTITPHEERCYGFRFLWAANRSEVRDKLVRHGLLDIQVLPGMTIPETDHALLAIRGNWPDLQLDLPDGCTLLGTEQRMGYQIYRLHFSRLGENKVWLRSNERCTNLEFFVTESLHTLIEKRGRFIAQHQICDSSKWYDGLLAEWNNETGALLSPDNYDQIKGWRIYEVTCDDPGLSKPAFLSSKLVESPVAEQIAALDHYVEHFVWGGLQRTEDESYAYGLYGIPDWHALRTSNDPDIAGNLHLWRIYDYPHIALMYYNLYRIARLYPDVPLSQDAQTYLIRAAQTLIAMFTIPLELDNWSAFGTGLYNELVAEDILSALETEGLSDLHRRLKRFWDRKAYQFSQRSADVFGSEYPFDTTGFESTHILAKRALQLAKPGERMSDREISPSAAASFMETQMRCNIACRGEMEMTYWWYGSDYRGDNLHYTLSYMSQMGGWALLDYALYFAEDPFPTLRLGYGSLLSSWALLNTGRADTNWGWCFPGQQHDGAASGGFEPQYLGSTWLDQPHHGGAWYYSCEIDLGFCGYLRGAATIYAIDPIFGAVCLGGQASSSEGVLTILPADGVNRRIHIIDDSTRIHLTCSHGRILHCELHTQTNQLHVYTDPNGTTIHISLTLEQFTNPGCATQQSSCTTQIVSDHHSVFSLISHHISKEC